MFRILIVLLVGIVLGFTLRRVLHIRQVETSAHYTICALLFVFGLGLGSNDSLMHNIGFYGLEAVVVALLGMAGSYQCGGHLFHGRMPAFHPEQYRQQALYAHRHLPWSLSGNQRTDACHLLL